MLWTIQRSDSSVSKKKASFKNENSNSNCKCNSNSNSSSRNNTYIYAIIKSNTDSVLLTSVNSCKWKPSWQSQSRWSMLTWFTPSRRKVIELIPNPLWNLVLPYKALISISSSIRALSHCAIRVKRYGSPFRFIWMLVSIISRRLSLCTKASFATAIAATTAIAEVTCATILVAAPAAIAAAAAQIWPSGRLIGRFMFPAFLVWFSADFRSSSSQSCLRPWQHVSERSLSQIFGFSKTVLSFSSNTELGRKTNCKLCCADWRWWLKGPSQRVV